MFTFHGSEISLLMDLTASIAVGLDCCRQLYKQLLQFQRDHTNVVRLSCLLLLQQQLLLRMPLLVVTSTAA